MMTAKLHHRAGDVLIQLVALAVGLVIIFPIFYCLMASFFMPSQVLSKPPLLFPTTLYLQNYITALTTTTLNTYLMNSLLIATVCSVVRLITGSLAAFAFAFFNFKGKNFFFFLILGTMMIPSDAIIVTNYLTVSSMKLVNTYLGVMIIYFVSAMNVFMMRQYFMTVSKTLREAAYIDGCGNFRFYTSILIPVSKPVMATVFTSSFVSLWNIYMWPLLVTNVNHMRTVQVGITMLSFSDNAASDGPTMAASMIVLIPTILVFLLFRGQLVKGITDGSVKE